MDTTWAPIALFIYKRPEHTRRMIEHLQQCSGFDESPVYVFADGPSGPRDMPAVRETRSEARRLLGDRAVYREHSGNVGLDDSEIAAITELCEQFGRVVVVEDDLVVSPDFLRFLNQGLHRYESEPRVMQVCGHMFDVPELRESQEAILLPLVSSWGWGTWKRAWDLFDPDARGWAERLGDPQERERFDLHGNFAYTRMLSRQMRLRVPAWDIRWYYSVFVLQGLALYPPRTLVVNEGFDGSGTHGRLSAPVRQAQVSEHASFELPGQIAESSAKEYVFRTIRESRSLPAFRRITAAPRSLLRRWRRA